MHRIVEKNGLLTALVAGIIKNNQAMVHTSIQNSLQLEGCFIDTLKHSLKETETLFSWK